jgi:DNA repair protein RadC
MDSSTPPTALAAAIARIVEFGAGQLSDTEIVAVLIGAGVRGRDAFELAHELLSAVGGLRELLRASPAELIRARGMGPASAARLAVALEAGRRYLQGSIGSRRSLTCPTDAAKYFRARLSDLSYEVFACLYLDTRHRMLCFEPLFRGTVDGATVYPREVLRRALHHNAAAVILGHNHPSGDCEPSEADRNITARLAKALALVDVRLLDHLVVAGGSHVSLAERGWI